MLALGLKCATLSLSKRRAKSVYRRARQDRFKAQNLPAVLFLDADGNERGRVAEYLEPDAFVARLDQIEHGTALLARCD